MKMHWQLQKSFKINQFRIFFWAKVLAHACMLLGQECCLELPLKWATAPIIILIAMLFLKQIQTMCLHLTTKKWYLLFKFTHNFKQSIYKNKLFSRNRLFSLIASVRISEYMWRKVISRSKTENYTWCTTWKGWSA